MKIKDPCFLTVHRFVGAKAITHHQTKLNGVPVADMLEALAAVRQGLPPGYGAGLTDACGTNVVPTSTKES